MSGSSDGGVNTSLYSNLIQQGAQPPAPPNPLGIAQGFQQLQRTGLENNQMLMQQKAQYAIGRAAQAATNPATGQVDEGKLVGLISQDPDAAYLAQTVQSAITARKLQEQQISSSQLENGMKIGESMVGQLGTLINDPNLTRDKVFGVIQNYLGMANHGAAVPAAMNILGQLPQDDSPASQQQMRQILTNAQTGFKGAIDAFKMAHPDFIPINRGVLGTTFYNPSGVENTGQAGGTASVGMSPETAAQTVEVVDPATGQKHIVFKGNVPGLPGASAGGGSGAMLPPGAVAPGQGGGQGAANGSPGMVGPAPTPGASAPPPGQSDGLITTGADGKPIWNPQPTPQKPFNAADALATGQGVSDLTPAQKTAQEEVPKTWNEQTTNLSKQIDAQNQVVQFMGYEQKLAQLTKIGPGAQTSQQLGTLLQGLINMADPKDAAGLKVMAQRLLQNPDDPQAFAHATAAAQSFNAIAAQRAAEQVKGTFGDRLTNDEFASQVDATIKASTDPGAIAQLFNIGKQRLGILQAQAAAAQSFARARQGDPTGPNWNEFLPGFVKLAQAYGHSGTAFDPQAPVNPNGDTEGLLQATGMHPQANNPQATSRPSRVPEGARYVPTYNAWYAPKGNGKWGLVTPPAGGQ